MDACARIRGVPLKTRASIRKETIHESSIQILKSLVKSRKELCSIVVELHPKDPFCLTEINYVGLPSHAEGEDVALQALTSVPLDLMELLRSLHVHSLKDEELLLLKDSRKLLERKDSISQTTWSKAICVFRRSHSRQSSAGAMSGLLTRYMTGIRYALELQSLLKSTSDTCQVEDDDTNQSVSSIEDDFVTAFEHLDEDETAVNLPSGPYSQRSQRDVASQTVPAHCKDLSGSRILIGSSSRKTSVKKASLPDVSVSVHSCVPVWSSGAESQWNVCPSGDPRKGRVMSSSLTESDESDCSSPSPIIFLDEVGYQKSLKAKIEIPKIPVFKDSVEDSDSEVSEFFDSFDQFDDLEQALVGTVKLFHASVPADQKNKFAEDSVVKSRGSKAMNPHRFDHPILPANIRKPTPLKPGSVCGAHSDLPDSPLPVKTFGEESGALFSPVRSSAFSPLADCSTTLEYFWKADGDENELPKPQDLCSLYKTYSDFASSMSKEILGSVCGYSSPVDMNVNKNLSCVCHKEFTNSSGHVMKLSDIQQTVTVSKAQKSQTLKEGIQKFATDLVEMSLGSAFRDLQKGVSCCTTTLCHLAARLTSSVFQMAFHEIGMRHAYVLKERAINGLASFLVGEAVSGALKEFRFVKKQIYNNTVARFAADLAEELVFEGIMEVCQFSHPSTPLTPNDWSFEQEEEVVSSYASDLSESVLQEAFIELSQADVTFTTQAAISVSLDNIHYVSAEDNREITKTCDAANNYPGSQCTAEVLNSTENGCTVRSALFCMSGIASCVPVPVAGKVISEFQNPAETCQCKSSICNTSQTSPKKSSCSEGSLVTTSTSDMSAATQTELLPSVSQSQMVYSETCALGTSGELAPDECAAENLSAGNTHFHDLSGSMVDLIVSEAYEIMTASKVKKKVEDCADYLSKKIVSHIPLSGQTQVRENVTESTSQNETVKEISSAPTPTESAQPDKKPGMHFKLHEPVCHCLGSYDKLTNPKGADQTTPSLLTLPFNTGLCKDTCESSCRDARLVSEVASEICPSSLKDTLEVPGFESSGRGARKMAAEGILSSSGRKSNGAPGTPPPTPQQLPLVSQEKQIKRFSKKLKGKLAKEFSPATPPSTPHYQSASGVLETGTDSENFMLKLMRSLSEEAGSNEDEENGQDDDYQSGMQTGDCQPELNASLETDYKMVGKGAFRYAERLACHIVSMATEMDTLGLEDRWKLADDECKDHPPSCSAQFSEQTLNSLLTYAGEMAGEVINDVKKMMSSSHHRPKVTRRGRDGSTDSHHHIDYRDSRFVCMANQWSSDLIASVTGPQISGSSGLSSKYPSCESVTDEYSGYLIRVLKREGGNRELILDQYASRLAYRSIKLGLAHAARKIKQRSSSRLPAFRRLNHDGNQDVLRGVMTETEDNRKGCSSREAVQCTCRRPEGISRREYVDLVNFAESLAYNITCDVTNKFRLSSVRLPKSLTDSCLYKRSKLEDVTENLIRTTFSCSLLPYTEKTKQYHSTGSLNDSNYSDGVMQVIEHYARKIVDDTLEMTFASTGQQAAEEKRTMGQNYSAKRVSEARLSAALADKACHYCVTRERPYFRNRSRQHIHDGLKKQRQEFEAAADSCCKGPRVCSLEIPKIHIDFDKRAAFAEEMVSSAIEKAKRELSSTSLNADSGIGHDGASFAESLTTEIMTSAMSNVCQTINLSAPGTHTSESTASQQLSLSVGDDSIGSWSNLSFEEEPPDETSSFLHLSDSNGNSSSWSSLGLEGEIYEERLSFSPSDSDSTEDKETETKEDFDAGPPHIGGGLLVVNTDGMEQAVDPQVRAVLQWIAASQFDLPVVQLSQAVDRELQLLPAVLLTVRERDWKVGELLQAVLRYCDEAETEGEKRCCKPLFQWLVEHA